MMTVMLLGVLLGMRHALEADHVAAVASLVLTARSPRSSLLHGAVWGVGHTVTLIVVGTFVILTQSAMATSTAAVLEGCVGIMLVLLGLDVARRLLRGRMHLHVHEHPGGVRHFHAHSHPAASEAHDHEHAGAEPHGFPKRALFIGSMHGLAGSAALILLALRTTDSIGLGLLYMALFGLGSVIGMALLSVAIAVPFNYSATHNLRRLQHRLQCVVSMTNVGLGAYVIAAAYSAV
jgi:ABC-type nickel/cobalt efflux system permease component RcnA